MEAATPIEAKKHGLRQSQDGHWTLTLILHPSDTPDWLLTAPMGQRLALVVAALKDEAERKPESEKPRKPFSELPLSQQAALKCGDADFQQWLRNKFFNSWAHASDFNTPPDQAAAKLVREMCGVSSRSELDTDKEAARVWTATLTRFLTETGRMAEQR